MTTSLAADRSALAVAPAVHSIGVDLPDDLAHFAQAIARSHLIVEWEPTGENADEPIFQESTWQRAVDLAIETALAFQTCHPSHAPAPGIGRGPKGSIDVLWMHGTRKLMINVPPDENEPPAFHGYDREAGDDDIKGVIRSSRNNAWVVAWLVE